ncbi:MAG: sodium:solute symporter [Acidobacteria bacterium]|nr:sodium:solute symporter [Acidobacteriota bacterium]
MQKQTLAVLDYLVILAYMLAMVWMGWYFSKRQKDTDHYYAGNRRIPSWAVGISILATLISSVTFLAYPGAGYSGNWILLVQGLMVPIVLLAVLWIIVPVYREAIRLSAYEYFEKRFSYASRLYTSLAFSVMHFTKMGTVVYLLSLALSGMTGWDIYLVIAVVSLATLIYTLIGGIEAVVWTDVVQGFLFLAGGLACILILLFRPEGGPAAVVGLAWKNGKIDLGPYDLDFVKLTFVVMAINGIFYALQKYGTDQTIVQRFLLAKDDRSAIRATLLGALLCVPTWTAFIFIGTCLWSFYRITGIPLPPDIKSDGVFPYFIMTELPAGVTGLILSALLAAAMSTLASDLNCLSAVAVEDYYRRLRPHATDKKRLAVGKGVVLVCGLVTLLVAAYFAGAGEKSVLGSLFELYAIFSGGIVGLFALAFFTRRANRKGAIVGIVACILFTAWAVLSSPIKWGGEKMILLDLGAWGYRHHNMMLGVYSHIVLFVVGYAASLFFKHEAPPRSLTIHGWLERRRARQAVSVSGPWTPDGGL